MTEVMRINPEKPQARIIEKAGRIIKEGRLVAFPTETVYGLGADALNPEAVMKIFSAKGRPADNPIIVHIAEEGEIYRLAQRVPREAELLMKKFFPGPLTLVLEKGRIVPDEVTANLPTVAIRMPDHKVALLLIREAGTPIAAPSANIAGRPSPTKAEHVFEDLQGKVELIIDGGQTKYGLESTVLDLTANPPQVLRPGAITVEMLSKVLGSVEVHPVVVKEVGDRDLVAKSPGMKYRHYAPKAELMVVVGKKENVRRRVEEMVGRFKAQGLKIGVATTTMGWKYEADHLEELGESKEVIARRLFEVLRRFDRLGIDVIVAEGVDEEGLGLAIMNRMKKASGYKVVKA